ncbi:MAG: carboxypeptidase-like regulatory domain-containing protein [Bacteroidales bacterium]
MKRMAETIIILFLVNLISYAQVRVRGQVNDEGGLPLPGANVMIRDTYDGTTTDTAGVFEFETAETGRQLLVVSFIGYRTWEQEIELSDTLAPVTVVLEEQPGEIKAVVITAGSFDSGDLSRPVVLKPMDIATTPSAVGDIYGALTTLPGAQIVGNEGGLYVRGGEGYETKTFIDGMQVASPYMSRLPDLPTRSRFSPVLFTGTTFSTGGYSAEYGQALSSAVNLRTTGLAEKSQGAVSVMSVGMSGSYTHRMENASLAGTLQYINMKPYYSLVKQNIDYIRYPVQTQGTLLFRQKYRRNGLLKVLGSFDTGRSTTSYSITGDPEFPSVIAQQSGNYYLNAVYNDELGGDWRIMTGLALGADGTTTGIDANELSEKVRSLDHRVTLTGHVTPSVKLKAGEEVSAYKYRWSYYAHDSLQTYGAGFIYPEYALFAESEININDRFVARAGFRGEFSPLLQEWQLVPRVSMAYHTGDYSQVSVAYGMFRQRPENRYLLFSHELQSERATHIILNYQYEVSDRIFRAEVYRKWYNNLVKFESEYNPDPASYSNDGEGFAQGIDLFWRDSRTIPDLDYWFSYSFIRSERNYRDYPERRVPSFISDHTFSAVAKYYWRRANAYAGLTYLHASPKRYYNPALPYAEGDMTKAYNDLSLNITWITPLFGSYCAFLLNISNLPGFEQVYGYHYSPNPDAGGNYTLYPIIPQSKRLIVIGGYFIF